MPWFRLKKPRPQDAQQHTPAAQAPAPVEQPAPPAEQTPAAPSAGPTDPAARPKRRRGTRGGRNRKKPGETGSTGPAAKADAVDGSDEAKPKEQRTERKREPRPERSQRQERRANQPRRREPPRRAPLPAAKRELLISVDVGESRVAILEDDRVAEVYLERPERRSIAGNIYLGTVDNVLPGMEAAFVEIGLEKNGFLYVDEIIAPELEGKRHGKKITDLIARGQTILVQAVKDPMKTKGARLTTEISLPGRFLVYVPHGEGLGVSRRLDDAERARLKEIIKGLDAKDGGIIVRTAAEGASAEDVERDLVFLQRLWKTIDARAKSAKAPSLVYQEAELPLRIVRDLFAGDFVRAVIDHERTYKRIVGYLKKTSPHMLERVSRYKEKTPLFEGTGVDAEIRSTLSRRVDLPSGGYLVFDYAEAFTVIDVNTGRFVGSRSKTSGARLEDTITKNNLEAVKEVVRQLRLRDIGGIIVIDFIDMANPKNRAAVEEALRNELERDRTKTYVVEISPLGLVEMTRQNVTDGPREILTKKCPTCAGDGIVVSEATAAMEVERRLQALAAGSRSQAFRIEVAARTASLVNGPGGARLVEIEAVAKKRFFLVPIDGVHADHVNVLAEGKLEELKPESSVEEGAVVEVKLGEIGRYDAQAGVGKVGDRTVIVGGAASLVGKKAKVRIERVLDDAAYAVLVGGPEEALPISFESEAEKPTRAPSRKKVTVADAEAQPEVGDAEAEGEDEDEVVAPVDEEADVDLVEDESDETEAVAADGTAPVKKKTRRGTRGGRNRKKKPPVLAADGSEVADEAVGVDAVADDADGVDAEVAPKPARSRAPRIHVPAPPRDTDQDEDENEVGTAATVIDEADPELAATDEAAADDGTAPLKKKTRRGSRGGRNRKKKPSLAGAAAAAAAADAADDDAEELEAEPEAVEEPLAEQAVEAAVVADAPGGDEAEPERSDDYVPMSEWLDEIEA